MRLTRCAPLLAVALAACTPPPPPEVPIVAATPQVAAPVESAAPAPAPLPPFDPSLPAGAAGAASIDVGKLGALLGKVMERLPASHRAGIERVLRVAVSAEGGLPRALGLDPARPIVASVGLVGPAQTARGRILALVGKPVKTAELRRVFDDLTGLAVAYRVALPTADGAAALAAITALIEAGRFIEQPPPAGYDHFFAMRRDGAGLALAQVGDTLIVDAVFPAGVHGEQPDHAPFHALRARVRGGPSTPPPQLDGHPARAHWTPAAAADIGLIYGVSRVVQALALPDIDEAQRDQIAAAGLAEAATSITLAGKGDRPSFDGVEVTLEGDFGALGVTANAGFPSSSNLSAAGWTATQTVDVPGAMALLDVSVRWARAWSTCEPDPLAGRALRQATRDAGAAGLFVAFPQLLVSELWQTMSRLTELPGLTPHLDRVLVFSPGPDHAEGHVALLQHGVRPADVTCALSRAGAPCDKATELRPGATARASGLFARLVQVKNRWAVIVSRDEVTATKTRLALVDAPPVRIVLPGGDVFTKDLRPLPPELLAGGYTGEVQLLGSGVLLRVAPAPAKAAKTKLAVPGKTQKK